MCRRGLLSFYIVQFLTGLASAASLFLAACGLSIIFGVTRIVNFAHGAFYMLGAYVAFTLTERLEGSFGFWIGLVIAAGVVAVVGALVEMLLLRRIYHAPELFQLLATFGVTLMVQDIVVLIWGPEDLVGRRAPNLRGAVDILGQSFPAYDLFLIALGPLVLAGLWLLFHRTRWGVLVRAATQDREMIAALGVNQKWLFTGVFALGVFLAALGGALQLPREAVNHQMDLRVIVDVFVVVVIGGLGSVAGAFLAAILVSVLNAFGILIFPGIALIAIFLVMAIVLVVRPWGLMGKPEAIIRGGVGAAPLPWAPLTRNTRLAVAAGVALAALFPVVATPYMLNVASEVLIFALFAASLHFMMGAGGLVSFGHAAYFGLGSYGAALAVKQAGLGMAAGLVAGPLLAGAGALVFGWFCVRLSGVYLAMLTMAFAQIVWSIAFQWVSVTGGDNGLLGVWPQAPFNNPAALYWLALALVAGGLALLRMLVFSPFGYALRATRDSTLRAESIGVDRMRVQWASFVIAGFFAGLAGALYAFFKGSVFPDNLAIPLSVDGLVAVLLGGVGSVSGAVLGAGFFKSLSIWLVSNTDYSKLALGAVIVALVVAFPGGIMGLFERFRETRAVRAEDAP